MCVADHKPLFRQSGETNSVTRFSLEFVNVGDEQKFPKTSVCIIHVDLVYLESANIYTGPKIVRGLKRLRTTAIEGLNTSLALAAGKAWLCKLLKYSQLKELKIWAPPQISSLPLVSQAGYGPSFNQDADRKIRTE